MISPKGSDVMGRIQLAEIVCKCHFTTAHFCVVNAYSLHEAMVLDPYTLGVAPGLTK